MIKNWWFLAGMGMIGVTLSSIVLGSLTSPLFFAVPVLFAAFYATQYARRHRRV
jgi:hypothetical protein